jgi:uncharacterized repeat protein (TIGR01451 family)
MPALASITLTYTLVYIPLCETDPAQDQITNQLAVVYNSSTVFEIATEYMQENAKCQLSVCKMNHADANPHPSIADCTNVSKFQNYNPYIQPPALSFPGPTPSQTFTIFYENSASSPVTVGTVRDSLSVSSPLYGNFPISYKYSCAFLPNPLPAFTSSPPATVQWNNPLWAGVDINFGPLTFPPSSTYMCEVVVSTLGPQVIPTQPLVPTPTLCQGSVPLHTTAPQLIDSALMDLTQGVQYINTSDKPTAFSQASVDLPLCQNVTMIKTVTPVLLTAGGTATVTITVQNNENTPITGFTVMDNLKVPNFSNPFIPVCTGSSTPCAYTVPSKAVPSTTNVIATILSIAPGGAETITFTVTASSTDGVYENVANGLFFYEPPCTFPCFVPIGAPYPSYSGVGNSLTAAANVHVLSPTLAKSFSPTSVIIGTPATVTFTITNVPGSLSQNVNFTDTLPSGLYFVSTPVNNCGGNAPIVSGNDAITYTNPALSISPCTITVQVSSTLPGAVGTCGTFTNNQSNLSNVVNLDTSGVNASLVVTGGNGQSCAVVAVRKK